MKLLPHIKYDQNPLVVICVLKNQNLFNSLYIKVQDLNLNPALPFKDKSFDVVLIQLSVDYLKRPLELFKEVSRVLCPGGELIVRYEI